LLYDLRRVRVVTYVYVRPTLTRLGFVQFIFNVGDAFMPENG